MKHIEYILRERTEDDTSFIYSSWLHSFKEHSPCKFAPNTLYFKPQTEVIDFVLKRAITLVACFPEEPSEIIAYICYEIMSDTIILHWIYVKDIFRHKYTATDIIKQITKPDDKLIIATHITDNFNKLKYKLEGIRILYDPFLITNLRLLKE